MSRLKFEEHPIEMKLFSVSVANRRGDNLGQIIFDRGWNCWTWNPEQDLRMSADCLQEIVSKLKSLARRRGF